MKENHGKKIDKRRKKYDNDVIMPRISGVIGKIEIKRYAYNLTTFKRL